jgi:hypothetical protein
VRRPRQAQRPQPSPPGLHRRRPRRSAPPKRRVSVRSWGRVARRLELGERALRRRGCFGARENYYPVRLELASPRSGRPYSRVRPLHRPPAGRKEPPNPIPETHNEHLRRQTLEPCRPCAATTPRATPPACGRRVLDPRISSPCRSERCSFARGLPARRSSSPALISSWGVHATVWGSSSTGTSSRPWKAEILHWECDSRASGPPSPTRLGHSARRHFRCSIKSSITTANWTSCKLSRAEESRVPAPLQNPLTDSNRRPPPYHGTPHATVATHGNDFGLFLRLPI